MRKTISFIAVGAIALGGLALSTTGTPATADPGDATARLGAILAGSLSDHGGASGWAGANAAAITAQSYDAAAAGREATAAQKQALTVDVAGKTLQVGDSCSTQTKVDYVLGTAGGRLDADIMASLELKPGSTAMDFTDAEAISLVPALKFHVQDPDGEGDYTADLTARTLTASAGNSAALDAKLMPRADEVVDTMIDQIGPEVAEGLNLGIPEAISNTMWDILFDRDVVFSFGYPFGPDPADQLVNGRTARIDLAKIIPNTWVSELATSEDGDDLADLPVAGLSWRDFLPQSAVSAIDASPLKASFDQLDFRQIVGQQVAEQLQSSMPMLVDQASAELQRGINAGLDAINTSTDPLLADYPDSKVSLTKLGAADKKTIATRLDVMGTAKAAGQWRDAFVNDGIISAGSAVVRTFQLGPVTELVPTGVTVTDATAAVTVGALNVQAGESGVLSPDVAGSPTLAYTSSDPQVATVDAAGRVTGVADGQATITVTATWPCSNGDPVTSSGTALVTVAPREATWCDTLPGITAELKSLEAKHNDKELTDQEYFSQVVTVYKKFLTDKTPAAVQVPLQKTVDYFDLVLDVMESGTLAQLTALMSDEKQAEMDQVSADLAAAMAAACPVLAAPTITQPTDGAVLDDDKPTVSGTAQAGAGVRVDAPGGNSCTATATSTGVWYCALPNALPDGPAVIQAYEVDSQGNASSPAGVSVTVETGGKGNTVTANKVAVNLADLKAVVVTTNPASTVSLAAAPGEPPRCSGTADSQGAFTCALDPPLQAGDPFFVTSTDPAGDVATLQARVPAATVDAPGVTVKLKDGAQVDTATQTVRGQFFAAGETVQVFLQASTATTPTHLGDTTADSDGRVAYTWGVTKDMIGTQAVALVGAQSQTVAAAAFEVVSEIVAGTTTTCPTGTITVEVSGSAHTFKATGYNALDQVDGTLVQLSGTTAVPVATLPVQTAPTNGTVQYTWTKPATAAAGTYEVRLSGPGACAQSKQFTLGPAGTVTTAALAQTGPATSTTGVGLTGLLALGLGGICLMGVSLTRRPA
ncbi:MAG: Ig-like domain-containing protein, partial [Propionibacteriaceae bacterium]|nr:Ig-like domain-containing protein [Propionibacteriaceae bacterium]